nr:hypothetical protein [uncultured bacterium]
MRPWNLACSPTSIHVKGPKPPLVQAGKPPLRFTLQRMQKQTDALSLEGLTALA